MLTVQHLSRLGPQGAIVSKGAGPPPLVTGRRVKPIIGEAWEIQQGRGSGGTPSLWKSTVLLCLFFLFLVHHQTSDRDGRARFVSSFNWPSIPLPAPPLSHPSPTPNSWHMARAFKMLSLYRMCAYVYILPLPRSDTIETFRSNGSIPTQQRQQRAKKARRRRCLDCVGFLHN